MTLPRLSTKRPVTVTMFFLGIAFLGVYALGQLGVDLLPDVKIPHLTVITTYSNASPEEVEKLVTTPLEASIGTLRGVKKVTSVSKEGMSVISVDYIWGTDMQIAFLSLREKLDNMQFALPREAERPVISRSDPSSLPVMNVVISYKHGFGKTYSGASSGFISHNSPQGEIKKFIELREAARVIFKKRLEQVNGIALAVVTGGLKREILIEINPVNLKRYGLSFVDVKNSLRNANINMPAGYVMDGQFRYALVLHGEFKGINDIENTVVKRFADGRILYLKDIAKVTENFKDREGLTRFNGRETVGLLVYKEAGTNTVTVVRKAREAIRQLKKRYPGFDVTVVYDQSSFISNAISNIKKTIFYGGILATLVLFLFLSSLRNILIIALSIPASLALAVFLMFLFGINFNVVSLGGIAVGIGMLLDNSIVVLENIERYREKKLPRNVSSVKGAEEVSMPIVASTFTTLAVFAPLLFISGIAGALFKDQSYAIIFSLASSILAALTLIPMLASRKSFFKFNETKKPNTNNSFETKGKIRGYLKYPFVKLKIGLVLLISKTFSVVSKYFSIVLSKFFSTAKKWLDYVMLKYEQLLEASLKRRKLTLFISLVLLIIALVTAIKMKKEFIPAAPQKEFIINVQYPQGVSLKGNASFTAELEQKLLKIPHVKFVVSNIGRVNDFDIFGKEEASVNTTKLILKTDSYKSYYPVLKRIKNLFSNIGRIRYSVSQIKSAYSEIINPSKYDIVIKIKDRNIARAYETGEKLIRKIKENSVGISDIRFGVNRQTPQYVVTIDRKKCGYYGVSVENVASVLSDIVKGSNVASFTAFDKKTDVKLKTYLKNRNSIEKILNQYFLINGKNILLKDLVSYKLTESYNEIWHENDSRIVFLFAGLNRITLVNAINQLKKIVKTMPKKTGETISIGGANENIKRSFGKLYVALLISLLLIYMVLAIEFESFLFPFVIILSVPLGLIGGILALALFNQSLNVISLIGLIILMGIANNDAVVKVDFILRKRMENLPMHEAIIEAGRERFRPIVMTSVTTIFGLLPMVIFSGAAAQLRISLSIAIMGGLITSTLLTLIVIPVIYSFLEKFSTKNELNLIRKK